MDTQLNSPESLSTIPPAPTNNPPAKKSKRILLIVLGILEIPFPTLALFALLPVLTLQNALETKSIDTHFGLIFFIFALVVALIQIVAGLFSYDLKLGNKKTKTIIIVGLINAVLVIPAIMISIIMPIYSTAAEVLK